MVISADQRRVLEALIERAEESEDDWGTTDAVREYLGDPDEDPERFLSRVATDVGWHLGHVGEGPEDDESAERARASINRAVDELRALRHARPARVAEALSRISEHRRALGLRPLDPAASGWSDDDVLAEAARIARNPADLPVRTAAMHVGMVGRDQHTYVIVADSADGQTRYGWMDVSVYGDKAHVDHVHVDPKVRRRGVATALYRELYDFAAGEGLSVQHGMFTDEGAAAWQAIRPRLGLPANPRQELLAW